MSGISAEALRSYITVGQENSTPIELYYEDHGSGTPVVQNSWNIAAGASPHGTLACVSAWTTDFRAAVSRVDVPTLIVHGDADRLLPIAATAIPLSKMIRGARLAVIEGGPHSPAWTHADRLNSELVQFLAS
jgi:non-heme chloroperoxidase